MAYTQAFLLMETIYNRMRDSSPAEFETAQGYPDSYGTIVELVLGFITPQDDKEILQGQVHIRAILSASGYDDVVFYGYLHALQLDNPNASHEDVMKFVWNWFEENTDPSTVRKLRVAFAEEEAAAQLGMNDNVLSGIRDLLADDDLYLTVLTYLKLPSTNPDLSYHEVFAMTGAMVERTKPSTWPPIQALLCDWRSSCANDLIEQARTIIQDDALYEEFSEMYLEGDEDEAMDRVLERTEDVDLVEELKRLRVSGASGGTRMRKAGDLVG
ncbi:hypothetical protein HK097_001277 [Rhizophlyctis rosea]|uniref:Uncharacterized protein n=1 Tax=Rhizophlyctis rosea TaxID=64517 RepID=A0AAD5S4J0_9FUNG|nr:hypothetical protein HK097_001277 [Rhizophlyctis rosea]